MKGIFGSVSVFAVIGITFLSVVHGQVRTELELYMANPEVRIAQKIYCQITSPGMTDKLQAFLDDSLIFEKTNNLQSEEVIVADYRRLLAGKHKLTVKIISGKSNLVSAQQTGEWRTLHRGAPKVGIDENNAICLNGSVFFPITSWMLKKSDFDSPIAATVNALLSEGWYPEHDIESWKDYLKSASTYGFYVAGPDRWQGFNSDNPRDSDTTRLANYIQQTGNYSDNLLAWFWDDEPDAGGHEKYNPATTIYSWTRQTHRYDTDHPVWVNLVGYNFTHGESDWHHNLMKEYCYLYNADKFGGQKTAVVDIASIAYYPYEYANHNQWSQWISLEDYALALDRIRAWNYDLLPIMTCIETQDLHDYYGVGHDQPCGLPRDYPWTPDITPLQLKNLIWISIIHGVKGITFFHHFCPIPEENLTIMQSARDQIESLAPIILGPDSGINVRYQELEGGRVDVMTKEYVGNPIIFAANLRSQKDRVKFTVPGLTVNKIIDVYEEGRSIAANDGFFEDDFSPLAAHIYFVQIAGNDVFAPSAPLGIKLNKF